MNSINRGTSDPHGQLLIFQINKLKREIINMLLYQTFIQKH